MLYGKALDDKGLGGGDRGEDAVGHQHAEEGADVLGQPHEQGDKDELQSQPPEEQHGRDVLDPDARRVDEHLDVHGEKSDHEERQRVGRCGSPNLGFWNGSISP